MGEVIGQGWLLAGFVHRKQIGNPGSRMGTRCLRLLVMVGSVLFVPGIWAAHVNPHPLNPPKSKSTKVSESQRTRRRMRHLASNRSTTVRATTVHSTAVHRTGSSIAAVHTTTSQKTTLTRASASTVRHRYHERFFMSSFAEGITGGDVTEGEDPVVRQAAIDALGNMNGTVVAIEPTSGRVLAM